MKQEYGIKKPKRFSLSQLKDFIFFMGPLSAIFDLIVYSSLWFIFKVRDVATFQTMSFSFSIVSNLVGMHIIRTSKIPFIQSNAHKAVYISSIALMFIGILIPFTGLGTILGFIPLELKYIGLIFGVTFLYCIVAMVAKKIYIKKFKEWI